MGWTDYISVLGSLGEFLGSLAVIVTLVYLALQVRILRKQLEQDYRSDAIDDAVAFLRNYNQQPETAELFQKASSIVDPDFRFDLPPFSNNLREGGMSELEIFLTHTHILEHMFFYNIKFWLRAPDKERSLIYTSSMARNIVSNPLIELWWDSAKPLLDTSSDTHRFIGEVDSRRTET